MERKKWRTAVLAALIASATGKSQACVPRIQTNIQVIEFVDGSSAVEKEALSGEENHAEDKCNRSEDNWVNIPQKDDENDVKELQGGDTRERTSDSVPKTVIGWNCRADHAAVFSGETQEVESRTQQDQTGAVEE